MSALALVTSYQLTPVTLAGRGYGSRGAPFALGRTLVY